MEGSDTEEVVSEKTLGRVLDGQESDDSSDKSTVKKPTAEAKATVKKPSSKPKPPAAKPPSRKAVKAKPKSRSKNSKGGQIENILEAPRKHATPKPRKQDGDEKVTEIKMKTGILFIYRGANHRVEFVRTV